MKASAELTKLISTDCTSFDVRNLSEKDILDLLKSINEQVFQNFQQLTLDLMNHSKDQIEALSKLINGFPIGSKCTLEIANSNSQNKASAEFVIDLIAFLNNINPSRFHCVRISNYHFNEMSFQELKVLIEYMMRHPEIRNISLAQNDLWQLDIKQLREIQEVIVFMRSSRPLYSPFHSLELWRDEELKSVFESWTMDNKIEYARKKMLAWLLTSTYSSSEAFVPFPLSVRDYLKLFAEFLILAEEQGGSVDIANLARHCLLLLHENRDELLKFLISMEVAIPENCFNFNFNEIVSQNLIFVLKRLKNNWPKSLRLLQLDVTHLEASALEAYAHCINTLPAPGRLEVTLYLSCLNLEKGGLEKIVSFIRRINNPKIMLSLDNMGLGQLGSAQIFEFIDMAFKNNQDNTFTRLSLKGNNLDKIGSENFKLLFDRLLSIPKIKSISLQGNNLYTLDLKALSEINQGLRKTYIADNSLIVDCSFWMLYELNSISSWDAERQYNFAKIYMDFAILASSWDDGSLPFGLTERQYFDLFQYFINAKPRFPGQMDYWVKCHISTETLCLALARSRVEAQPFYGHRSYGNSYSIDCYKLAEKDRLDFYLSAFDLEPEKTSFRSYHLYETSLPASLLISPFKELGSLDEDSYCEALKKMVFIQWEQSCQKIWADKPFYEPSLARLKNFVIEDAYDAHKLIEMTMWFLWVLTLLTTKTIRQHQSLGVQLKAILDVAEPTMRYRLAQVLINQIYSNEDSLKYYLELTHNQNALTQIPSIPVYQILMTKKQKEELESTKQSEEYLQARKETHEILNAIPSVYKEGHYQKSFVAALLALAKSEDLTKLEKLRIIKIVLTSKDNQYVTAESMLKTFEEDCGSRSKTSFETRQGALVKTYHALTHLCGAPATLRGFSLEQYFNEYCKHGKEDIEKQQKDINALRKRLFGEFAKAATEKQVSEESIQALFQNFDEGCNLQNKLDAESRREMLLRAYKGLIERLGEPLMLKRFSLPKYLNNFFDTKALAEKQKKALNNLKRRVSQGFEKDLAEKQLKQQVSFWYLIQGLGILSEMRRLSNISYEALQTASPKIFAEIFKLSKEASERYSATFVGLRNESALLTYLGKIRSLPKEQSEGMEKMFAQFMQTVLSQNQKDFYELRYAPSSSQHLQKAFLERKTLRELWRQGESFDFKNFIENHRVSAQAEARDYVTYLYSKIFQNKHLNERECLSLKAYLESKQAKEREAIKESLEAEAQKIAKSMAGGMALVEGSRPFQKNIYLNVQRYLIRLVETPSANKSSQLSIARLALQELNKLRQYMEFKRDLQGLIQELGTSSQKQAMDIEGWQIIDTDHFWDLLMCGTDVQGSCQRIDGTPSLNRCLLGYVMDGKNRMLCIKDASGKIMARAILRLLWDKASNCPVLFMEELYPAFLNPLWAAALQKFARLRAEALNLPLLAIEGSENSHRYSNPIDSLGSIAPWEYVDSIHRDSAKGEFTIPDAQMIYSPNQALRKALLSIVTSSREETAVRPIGVVDTIEEYCADYSVEAHERSLQFSWETLRKRQGQGNAPITGVTGGVTAATAAEAAAAAAAAAATCSRV